MSRHTPKAQQTRHRLLEAAFAIIRREGVQALSANKLAAEAGVSKGGVFHHFPQLEDLYLQLLDLMIARAGEDLDPASFRDFREYMAFVSDYLAAETAEAPERVTAMFYFVSQIEHKPAYRSRLKAMIEHSFTLWSDKLAFFFEHGLDAGQKDALIRLLDIYFCGFSLHCLIFRDPARYRDLTREFTELLICRIASPSG